MALLAIGVFLGMANCAQQEKKNSIASMTPEELALFMTAGYTDTARIERGDLLDEEAEALRQMRAGIAYMEEKYPKSKVEYRFFETGTEPVNHATLGVEGSGITVRIYASDEGYVCSDNFYSTLIQKGYAEILDDEFLQLGLGAKTYTRFPELLDGLLGENATAEDYITTYPMLTKNTDVYISADVFADIDTEELSANLKERGVYGSFTLYAAGDIEQTIAELASQRRDMEYVCFNCF